MKSKQSELIPTLPGKPFPIGPTLEKGGVNFCLYSKNADAVELLLFDHVNDATPQTKIELDPLINKTFHYWHVFVPGLRAGQCYGYRVRGPHDITKGHHFDPEKVLLDPYAKVVTFPDGYKGLPMKNLVNDLSTYDWEGDQHPRRPFSQTVIYELHIAGFTKHPSSGVPPKMRGTYAGLIKKIPYLVNLGITAVEFLPVFQFETSHKKAGLGNYWGYSPISFFAIHQGYSSSTNPLEALDEFRDLVKALHKAGIEVILDVVYNHTGEGGHDGPTICFKGIDNSVYYMLEADNQQYANYSGCGNTLNANHPIVRRMIIDSLHYWVKHMHVDGFRFDLASILSRDESGQLIKSPPILWDIETDPVLAGTKLMAEAWDAVGLYQVGTFVGDSWKEWNGKFRDDVRSFLKGDKGVVKRFVSRLIGSPDLYGHEEREPEQSINFVTCHDGFTLNDLVSYNQKHNEENGEDNRDGTNDNFSWNGGEEGPTQNPQIEAWRQRQIKNFFVMNLLAVGAPMLLMGDEVRRTQLGNNNAYCQDNEISWFDWSLLGKHQDLFRFVKHLIDHRLARDLSQTHHEMSLRELMEQRLITWHGVKLHQPDWSDHSHTVAFTVEALSGVLAMHFMINAYSETLSFERPPVRYGDGTCWQRWIDTVRPSPEDILDWNSLADFKEATYDVSPFSVVVLINRMQE